MRLAERARFLDPFLELSDVDLAVVARTGNEFCLVKKRVGLGRDAGAGILPLDVPLRRILAGVLPLVD